MKEYNDTLDLIKGVVLILMVFGHAIGISIPYYFTATFQMPVFIFISGFLFGTLDNTNDFARKTKRILVPLLTAITIYFLQTKQPLNLTSIINFVITPYNHLWYMYALLFYMAYILLLKKTNFWLLGTVFAFILLFGYWFIPSTFTVLSPRPTLARLAYAIIGYMFGNSLFNIKEKSAKVGLIPLLILAFIFGFLRFLVDSSFSTFPGPPPGIYAFYAVALSVFQNLFTVLWLGLFLNKYSTISLKPLNWLGRNSLVIYLYHIFFMFSPIYHWLMTTPVSSLGGVFVQTVVGIVMPLIVHICFKNFKTYNLLFQGRASFIQ